MTSKQFKRKPYYNIYKPLAKADAGAAFQFSYDHFKGAIFLEATRQQGERLEIGSKEQFNWDNKITFKMGVTDVATVLQIFSGRKTDIDCLHSGQDKTHTAVLKISKQTGKYDNYLFKLSRTDKEEGGEKTTRMVQMFVDHHEMAALAHFFRESLSRMLGFTADSDLSRIEHQVARMSTLLDKVAETLGVNE